MRLNRWHPSGGTHQTVIKEMVRREMEDQGGPTAAAAAVLTAQKGLVAMLEVLKAL